MRGVIPGRRRKALREHSFDRGQLAARGLAYEKIDQLLTDLLLGVR